MHPESTRFSSSPESQTFSKHTLVRKSRTSAKTFTYHGQVIPSFFKSRKRHDKPPRFGGAVSVFVCAVRVLVCAVRVFVCAVRVFVCAVRKRQDKPPRFGGVVSVLVCAVRVLVCAVRVFVCAVRVFVCAVSILFVLWAI